MTFEARETPDRRGAVVAVSLSPAHTMAKKNLEGIRLIAGRGVQGDAHAGRRVKHRSRVAANPEQPNLRQVHLIHEELLEELADQGFDVIPGEMGENITTGGLDILGLPRRTRLRVGNEAVIEITGLRNPCSQLDGIQPGLLAATLDREADGTVVRKAGVMAIVVAGGEIQPGDPILVELPDRPHEPLERV